MMQPETEQDQQESKSTPDLAGMLVVTGDLLVTPGEGQTWDDVRPQ